LIVFRIDEKTFGEKVDHCLDDKLLNIFPWRIKKIDKSRVNFYEFPEPDFVDLLLEVFEPHFKICVILNVSVHKIKLAVFARQMNLIIGPQNLIQYDPKNRHCLILKF
jgi:hypothetical protein